MGQPTIEVSRGADAPERSLRILLLLRIPAARRWSRWTLGGEQVVEVEGALGVVVDVGDGPPDAVGQDAGTFDVVGAVQDAPDSGSHGQQ